MSVLLPFNFRVVTRVLRTTIFIGLGVAALLLIAFGPRAGDALPTGVVIVDYWEKWTGVEEAAMRQIVDDFNASVGKDKGIFVRYLSTSSIEQKTLVSTAAGVPPDVAGLFTQNIAQLAALDALEPLDEMAAAHGITAATYKKVFWDQTQYEGRTFGLVSSAHNIALHLNTELIRERAADLRAAGLDPDQPPRSIDELDRFAKALDTYDASGRLICAGYIPQEPGWWLNYTPLWFGGRWWDREAKRFTFTDPAVVRSFQWVQAYSKRLGAQSLTEFRSGFGNFDSPQNAFLSRMVAMVMQGTFMSNFINNQNPKMNGKWMAVPFPSIDPARLPAVNYCNADMLLIPRGARHKREAFEFIAYVNRQDVMEKLALGHCKISPLSNVSTAFLEHHTNPYIRVFNELADSPNAHGTEPVPIYSEVQSEFDNFMQQLSLLQVTPEAGLAALQDRLQRKYDAFAEQQRKRRGGN